jgi:hypothetical protein
LNVSVALFSSGCINIIFQSILDNHSWAKALGWKQSIELYKKGCQYYSNILFILLFTWWLE